VLKFPLTLLTLPHEKHSSTKNFFQTNNGCVSVRQIARIVVNFVEIKVNRALKCPFKAIFCILPHEKHTSVKNGF
jgi:hypothetical protein